MVGFKPTGSDLRCKYECTNRQRSNLADSFALYCQGLHLGEVMVVGRHIGNDGLFIRLININVWRK